MKKLIIGSCVLILCLGMGSTLTAQNNGFQLTKLEDEIADAIQVKKPEWRHERVAPMTGSENVVLQQWSSEGQSVRIAIVSHVSQNAGAQAMRDLGRDFLVKESIRDLGEEGFSWGRGTVSFRKGNLIINVSAVIARTVLDGPGATASLTEERKLSKEFARLIADAIKGK